MDNGPVSPDGRSQWNGTEWVPLPAAPNRRGSTAQAVLVAVAIVVVAIVVLNLLAG